MRAGVRHLGSRAPSEKVSALLLWRHRQEDPPEDAAGRRIKDSRPADRQYVAPAGRARRRRRRDLRRRPADPRVQRRSPRAREEAFQDTGTLPRDIVADERRRRRRTGQSNASRQFVAPPSEKCVQLLELDAHRQLRSLERVRGEGADVFLQSIELHDAFRENPVHERTCTAQQLGGRLHHL